MQAEGVWRNRVLRVIYGLNREEVAGDWRKVEGEELHDLSSAPNIIGVMKSRSSRWSGTGTETAWKTQKCIGV
jgi:hypothetical protein